MSTVSSRRSTSDMNHQAVRGWKRAALGLCVAVSMLTLGFAPLATASPAQPLSRPAMVRLANSVVPAVSSHQLHQVAAPAGAGRQKLTITLTLKRSNQAGFEKYLSAVEDRSSRLYRQFRDQRQLTSLFGPSLPAYATVLSWLHSEGFTLVQGSTNRLTVTVEGTVAQASRAFSTKIRYYRLGKGLSYSNVNDPAVPARLAGYVESVSGLSDLARPTDTLPSAPASDLGPSVAATVFWCGAVATPPNPFGGGTNLIQAIMGAFLTVTPEIGIISLAICGGMLVATGVAGFYCLVAGLINTNVWTTNPQCKEFARLGLGGSTTNSALASPGSVPDPAQKIGLLEFDTFNRSDVADWLNLIGGTATLGQLSEVPINGGVATPGPGEDEVLLDIDTVMLLDSLPGTSYVVYDAPLTTSFQTMFNAMVDDGDTVISNSWSECEDEVSEADAESIDSVLQQAAASGVSVLNGTGDGGSTCLDGSPNTVGVPADSPNATAVGGSSAVAGPGYTYGTETWWDGSANDPPTGQGGYGVSQYFARPSYQNGLTSASGRSVPDVVANADPAEGIEICEADAGGCPDGKRYGGTSMATPEWAAYVADLNERTGQDLGFLNTVLYPYANTNAFHSAASLGSDFAHVGLGSPDLNNLAEALTGTSPGAVSPTTSIAAAAGPGPGGTTPADGSTQGTVEVVLSDANGVPVPDQTVTLVPDPGSSAVVSDATGPSGPDGTVVFAVTDTAAQAVSFTVTDATEDVTLAAQPTMDFVTPTATGASITAGPPEVPDDGTTQATISVYLENSLGQPASGKTVTLSEIGNATVYPSGSTSPGNTAVTGSNGYATFVATDTNAENVDFSAVDVTDGNLPVPGTASVTFYSGTAPGCPNAPVAAAGYSVSDFASGFADDPYTQLLPGNFSIGSCTGAQALAFAPDGNIYVGDRYTGTINVLPPSGGMPDVSNQLPDASFGADDLTSMAFGPDGELYAALALPPPSGVANNEDPEIVQLDPSTGVVIRVVASEASEPDPLAYCPGGLAVDPASGDLFVSGECSGYLYSGEIQRISSPSSSDPSVTDYASVSGIGDGGIPYQQTFAPDGTLYVAVGGDELLQVGGTNSTQPATVTPLVQYISNPSTNYSVGVAITGTSSSGAATTIEAPDLEGNVYSIDLTQSPPSVSTIVTPGPSGGAFFYALTGPDGCVYLDAVASVDRLGPGSCGSSGDVSTSPWLSLSSASSLTSPPAGSPVTFTATLDNVSSPSGTPVEFVVTGANPQPALVDAASNGTANFTYSAVHPGTDTVEAFATVGTTTLTSTPVTFTWAQGKDTSFVDLDNSPQGGTIGQPVTLTAGLYDESLSPPGPIADAVVTINLGSQSCQATTNGSGVATCTITPTDQANPVDLSASYAGSSAYTASSGNSEFFLTTPSQVATTTAVSSSVNPSTYGQSVTFTATVSPGDGGGSVAFYVDGSATPLSGCGTQPLGLVNGTTYSATCTTSSLLAGSHTISADFSGDSSYLTSNGSLVGGQQVEPEPTSFSIAVNGSNSATVPFGSAAALAATGLPSGASGSVVFVSGITTLCSATLPSTSCTTAATLAPGQYSSISATFTDTDGNYSSSSSTNTVSLTISSQVQPPVAVGHHYWTAVSTPLAVGAAEGLLAGDTLNGAAISGYTTPAHGALSVNPDGSFTYSPRPGFVGTDSFAYSLQNSAGTSSASVTIDVPARAHLSVTLMAPKSASRGSSFTYTITVANSGPDPALALTTAIVLPLGVSVVSSSPGANSACGALSWFVPTLAAGSSLTYTVVVKAAQDAPPLLGALAFAAAAASLNPDISDSIAVATTLA